MLNDVKKKKKKIPKFLYLVKLKKEKVKTYLKAYKFEELPIDFARDTKRKQ